MNQKEQEILQSYFRSLCNSYYIAYQKVQRLEKQKQELECETSQKNKETESEVTYQGYFWNKRLGRVSQEVKNIIGEIKRNNFYITITSKEEIVTLLAFFHDNPVENNLVINTDEEALKAFPTGEKMYEEFLVAYKRKSDDLMTEVYNKYF